MSRLARQTPGKGAVAETRSLFTTRKIRFNQGYVPTLIKKRVSNACANDAAADDNNVPTDSAVHLRSKPMHTIAIDRPRGPPIVHAHHLSPCFQQCLPHLVAVGERNHRFAHGLSFFMALSGDHESVALFEHMDC